MTSPSIPSWMEWHALPDAAVADQLQAHQPATAVGIDATQRWFHFVYQAGRPGPLDPGAYLTAGAAAASALLSLLLDHGLDPLFLPIQVPLDRGLRYVQGMLARGIPALLADPGMQALIARVRMRHAGPWPVLPPDFAEAAPAAAALAQQFQALTTRTARQTGPRLFWMLQLNPRRGVADRDHGDALLAVAAQLQSQQGQPPTRAEVIQHFYGLDAGEQLPPVRLVLNNQMGNLLGQVVPPLLGGQEDYYFPTSPVLGLDRGTLRAILYDWCFLRADTEVGLDYATLRPAVRAAVAAWYARHRREVSGLGQHLPGTALWVPGGHRPTAGDLWV